MTEEKVEEQKEVAETEAPEAKLFKAPPRHKKKPNKAADKAEKEEKTYKKVVSEEDKARLGSFAGKTWTGKCRWFNVTKGFGFIDPDAEEAKEHEDDVFVHQSALSMPGFRSLDEGELVEFEVVLGKNGLEAANVRGIDGVALRGHSVRPYGNKKDKMIRCYKCGQLGFHRASKCSSDVPPNACYHCHSTEHRITECPTYAQTKRNKEVET